MKSENYVPLNLRSAVTELDRALNGCSRVLELGCGETSPLFYLGGKYHIEGFDIYEPGLNRSLVSGKIMKAHLGDVRVIEKLFERDSFDAVVALDLIEHLTKEDGCRLITDMERISSGKVVILTPRGFVRQSGDENPWMEHKSGWTISEFQDRGFIVTGMYGWKALRGEYAKLRYKPRFIWGALSELSHLLYTRAHPECAFSLFAVKEQQKS